MMTGGKLRQGTTAWFQMVGTLMCEAASQAGLAPDLDLTLIERYADGAEIGEGLIQGIRFDVIKGKPQFRVGVLPNEQGDITIELTAAAARKLNLLRSADPEYRTALEAVLGSGDLRVKGDLSRLGGWFGTLHDPIVEQTD
jgi:hypothetical protein